MSLQIIITILLGGVVGFFLVNENLLSYTDYIIDIGLCILLLFVGVEIGRYKETLIDIKKLGLKILLIPFFIIIGSITGSVFAGLLMGMPINESGAIGAGLGWYTLSSMMLVNYSSELSALASISNVIRELIAFIIIPLIAKHLGCLESIAPAGATSMDTSLPIISQSTNSKTAIIAFVTGVILSTSVPLLVTIMINLK